MNNITSKRLPHAFFVFHAIGSTEAWTDMPLALTEFLGSANGTRTYANLADFKQSRIIVRIGNAPAANAKLRCQYATDEATWNTLCSVTMPATASTTNVGPWTNIPSGALTDTYLRIVGLDGDGVVDPSFGFFYVEFR